MNDKTDKANRNIKCHENRILVKKERYQRNKQLLKRVKPSLIQGSGYGFTKRN